MMDLHILSDPVTDVSSTFCRQTRASVTLTPHMEWITAGGGGVSGLTVLCTSHCTHPLMLNSHIVCLPFVGMNKDTLMGGHNIKQTHKQKRLTKRDIRDCRQIMEAGLVPWVKLTPCPPPPPKGTPATFVVIYQKTITKLSRLLHRQMF